MGKKRVLEELESKVSIILEKYENLKRENQLLKEQIESNLVKEKQLNEEIIKLKEEDELKELELEDIVLRINKSFGVKEINK